MWSLEGPLPKIISPTVGHKTTSLPSSLLLGACNDCSARRLLSLAAAGPCALGFVSLCNLPSESVLLSPRNRSQSSAAPKMRENRSRRVAVGAGPVPPSEQLGTLNKRGAFVVLFPPMRSSLRAFSELGGEVASVLSALKLPSSGCPPGVTLRLRGRRTASKTARERAKARLVRAASPAPACLRQSWLPCKSFRSCRAAAKPLRSGRKFLLFAAVWEEKRLFPTSPSPSRSPFSTRVCTKSSVISDFCCYIKAPLLQGRNRTYMLAQPRMSALYANPAFRCPG